MNKKLFIGSISFEATEQSLKDLFSEIGTVESAVIIMDRISGRSKGFGFVEMSTEQEAQKALDTLDGKELSGRPIVVKEALPPKKEFDNS
ncbi:MAG: RNA-binding protein [Candidatus Pacebacteria bacterium]|nr:RNA-binding protein [Candidatus Paceibacterota bacterium]